MKICKHCGIELNKALYSQDHKYKSCPKCSVNDGNEHIFLPYPEYFGVTKSRKTKANPDGAQSYCVLHRGDPKSEIPLEHFKCSKIEQ